MPARPTTWTRTYGASGWHLGLMLSSIALVAYVITTLGLASLWDPEVWWQSIAVWFVGAVVIHDLVLFPAYALADRTLTRRLTRRHSVRTRQGVGSVPLTNYVRVPTMVAAFTFLLFFPGILQQGGESFTAATGLTQAPFLERWLLLVGASYLLSGLVYTAASVWVSRRLQHHGQVRDDRD